MQALYNTQDSAMHRIPDPNTNEESSCQNAQNAQKAVECVHWECYGSTEKVFAFMKLYILYYSHT